MKSQARHVTIKHGQKFKKFLVDKVEDWAVVAQYLVKNIKPGSVIALSGLLGAGKTTLTQFIARELGVKKNAISPTFALIRIYHIAKPLTINPRSIKRVVHVDAYRIENEQDALALDLFEEIYEPGTVVLIEWPENIKNIVSRLRPVKVSIKY